MPIRRTPEQMDRLVANVEAVRRLARVLVRDPHRADDVAQDTFLAALERPPDEAWPLRAWLTGVTRNMARHSARSEGRRHRREHGVARTDAVPSTADVAARMSEQRRLIQAVESLSPALQTVVWLRFWDDLPPRAIAARLDLPVETVRTRLKRACARLRVSLDAAHGGDRSLWMTALVPIARTGTPSANPSLVGGSLMTTKGKTALVLVGILAAALIAWMALDPHKPAWEHESAPPLAEVAADTTEKPALDGRVREVPAADPLPAIGTRRVLGIVRTRGGESIPNAEVLVGPRDVRRLDQLQPIGRTSASGRFELALPDDPAELVVAVDAVGFLPEARFVATSGEIAQPSTLEFRLHAVRVLHFLVLDGDAGEPLEGVRCETVGAAGGVELISDATSDARGRIAIRDASPHRLAHQQAVRFLKPGYHPRVGLDSAWLRQGHATPEAPREVYLHRGDGLRLRVVDESGRGVEGARVTAWTGTNRVMAPLSGDPTSDEGSFSTTVALGSHESGPDGQVTVGVPLREWSNFIATASHGGTKGWQTGFHNANDAPKAPEIVLLPTHRVEGQVVDEQGEPVARARVGHGLFVNARGVDPRQSIPGMPPDLYRQSERVTDAEGRFAFAALAIPPLGEAARRLPGGGLGLPLLCLASGFRMKTVFVERPAKGDDVIRMRIELEPSRARLRVRVEDDAGRPVSNALVRWRLVRPFAHTDHEGRAILMGPFHDEIPLVVSAPGYATATTDIARDAETVTVALAAAETLEGRVLFEDGAPAAAYVDIFKASVADLPESDPKRVRPMGPNWIVRIIAGADGRFRCPSLTSEPVFVHAFASFWNGPRPTPPAKAGAVATPGTPLELRLKRPEAAPPGQVVEGYAVDGAGARLTRYTVLLRARDVKTRGRLTYRPVQQGWRFRFEDVPPGPYVIELTQAKHKARHDVDVDAGRDVEGVHVVARATATIRGRLRSKTEGGLQSLPVTATGEDGRAGFVSTGPDGSFTFEDLSPGRYRLSLLAVIGNPTPWQMAETEVVLQDGETKEIVVDVEKAARIVLVLDDERFASSPNETRGYAAGEAGRNTLASRIVLTDGEGRERSMQGLMNGRHPCQWAIRKGTYTLRIETKAQGSFERTVEVTGPGEIEIEVRLAP